METDNDIIVKNLLDRTFFTAWKKENITKEKYANYKTLEVQLNANCDLKCGYCYYAKYKEELYPSSIAGTANVLKNFDMLLNWLEENQLFPNIEPFSGEPFAQNIGFEVFEKIVDFYIRNGMTNNPAYQCVIPTNCTFIDSDEKTERMERILTKAKDNGVAAFLSISIDGKLMDDYNRPFHSGKIRTDAYYDKLFAFAKKWGYAFHPMIYNNKIELWKDNFLWFQEMFKKFDLPFYSIYLLEVRNREWTKKQIKEFYNLIRFLVNWYYNFLGINGRDFLDFTSKYKLSNLFGLFYRVGRGTGCSTQSTMQLRLGDLTHSICHRAARKPHNLWKFETDGKKIIGVKSINAPLFVTHQTLDEDTFPMCETCFIKELCNGQCMGSMFETNTSLFIPIPTVCVLEHAKMAAVLDECEALGVLSDWCDFIQPSKADVIKIYQRRFRKEN